jgi:hypothetical protein
LPIGLKIVSAVKIQSYEQNDELKKLRERIEEGLLKTFNKTLLLILNTYTEHLSKKYLLEALAKR